MSSFSALEISRDSSRPLEVFVFVLGSQTYRYTSSEEELTIAGDVYSPIAIRHTRIIQDSESRRNILTITVPANNEFAAKYRNIVPADLAEISIYRYQRDEVPAYATRRLIYKGVVKSVRFPDDGLTAEIGCRSLEAATSKEVPRYTYMSMCNHILYDANCGVDPALFTITGLVTDETGNTVTVTGANSQADGYWTGGYCKPQGQNDFRLIKAHSGNVLTLLLPFATPVDGTNLEVFAGCDHTLNGDCSQKFDNAIEFGGFAFVPNRNPFESGIDNL